MTLYPKFLSMLLTWKLLHCYNVESFQMVNTFIVYNEEKIVSHPFMEPHNMQQTGLRRGPILPAVWPTTGVRDLLKTGGPRVLLTHKEKPVPRWPFYRKSLPLAFKTLTSAPRQEDRVKREAESVEARWIRSWWNSRSSSSDSRPPAWGTISAPAPIYSPSSRYVALSSPLSMIFNGLMPADVPSSCGEVGEI